eukprot:jgi/Mesvir1/15955/Mv08270-RA.1
MAFLESEKFKGLQTKEYFGHKKKVHTVGWNCTGRKLASGSVDHTARVYTLDPHNGVVKEKELELRGHTDTVDQLCWHPSNPDVLATISADKTVRLWDTRVGGQSTATVQMPGENINISWSPNGRDIAVGDKDDLISIIDCRTYQSSFSRKFSIEVNEFSWSLDGSLFVIVTGLGSVEIVTYPEFKSVHAVESHTGGAYSLAMDPTGGCFATGGADGIIAVHEMEDFVCFDTITSHECNVRTLSFSNNGQYLASGSEDSFVDISQVDLSTRKCRTLHRLPCRAALNSVKWNPKHMLLAHAGDDRERFTEVCCC